VLITFSGLDGAGKSTLISRLRTALEREGHAVTVLHMNDDIGVYAYLRWARNRLLRILGRAAPRGPRPTPGSGRGVRHLLRRVRHAVVWSKAVRRCVYPIDLLLFALYRLYLEKWAKRILITDRYFYDTLVDVADEAHVRWNALLARLTPTPDVPLFLDVPPEQAGHRKNEYPLEYLRARWTAYDRVLRRVHACVRIPNTELDRAQATVWEAVSARLPSATRVLVLDGESNQALACVRSLGRAGYTVFVASPRRFPLAAWSRYCRGHVHLSANTVGAFRTLRTWARDRRVEVVLPQSEPSVQLCNAERGQWEAAGIILGCGMQGVMGGAFDKARTLDLAATCGLRLPPTRFPASLAECYAAAAAIGYPCVVKPRLSHFWDGDRFVAGDGACYIRDPGGLEAVVSACRQGEHWPLMQGFVPGRGKAVFALYDHGVPVVWFAHERLRDVRPTGSGSTLRRSIPLDPRLQEPAARLLAALKWHGPAMVEFRDEGTGEPTLMEVNGRFWGSLELAVASGVDFPTLWVSLLRGMPVAAPTGFQSGVTRRWLWGDVKRLLYVMAGRPRGYPERYPSIREGLRELVGEQPPGTLSETWSATDRWPAVGEWVQGVGELLGRIRLRRRPRTVPAPPSLAPLRPLENSLPLVSVIVPCRNEERYIARCLDSILAGDYPRDRLEVLVVDGRSDDRTREILDAYVSRQPGIRVVDNPGRIQPSALNAGIRAARGEILIRMDAHVLYPSNYIPDLVAALRHSGADNVGGVLVTRPGSETAMARAIAIAMAHPFGVGNAYFRIGVGKPRWVDTIAFFCCRRETFEQAGWFDEDLARNEDGEFNARLIMRGGRILLVPHVVAYYYARDTVGQAARMFHQYGYFKPLVARKLGRVMSLRQLVPPGFVAALAATAALSPWLPAAGLAFGTMVSTYFLAVGGCALAAGRRAGLRGVAALVLVFPVIHFSYGLGFLLRLLKFALPSGRAPRPAELPLSR